MPPGASKPQPEYRPGDHTAAVKTLVVTDLVGSTRLFATLGDLRATELSARHERLARDLVRECGGREIDKTDGFLLLFERAVDAVRFALAYHRGLAGISKSEGVDLAARVGIHLGEVYERRNPPDDVARGAKPVEIEGVTKPVAARVMALAEGRQTLLTRTAFDLARQGAASEPLEVDGRLRWLAHGPYRLKGVDEPVEIFEVGVTGFAPLVVPKSTAKARRAVSGDEELTLGWRPAPGLEIPRRPNWRLSEKLGEGGFGEVWLAKHAKTGEKRVFKFCYRADRLRSLQREVTLFRLLKETLGARPDIARILDWNFEKAPYFLESEHTEGGNLLEWTAEQGGADQIPLPLRLELIAQVADALAAAHSVGVLHKDVKPSNVLITTGPAGEPRVRLTDFGIGMVTDRDVLADRGITLFELTEMVADSPSTAGGTHLYMAPELVEGRTPTVQADLYALGVMLYQFVVGDFRRALAPGWRRDVGDALLCEDVAAMVDGRPEHRLRDAQEVAERLRTLDERRARRDAEERESAEREAQRLALERAQRRRRLSALVAAATTVVLLVVSTLAYQAVEARKEAEHRRAQAENLIGFMVGDLREKLEPIGRLDILDDVGDQALQYFDAVPADDLTDDEIYRRSQALYQIGEVRFAAGDLDTALQAYQDSLEGAQDLPTGSRTPPRWLKGLATSHFGVGHVYLRQGKLQSALEHFGEYLEIAEQLVNRYPDEPEWQLETAYALSNIGSVQQAQNELHEAARSFNRSLRIREQIVEIQPRNQTWKRGLGVAHNKLGVVLANLGEPLEALDHFEQDLQISKDLASQNPRNADLLHRVGVGHAYVGHLLEALGRYGEAEDHLRRGRTILSGLAERDPENSRWRRDLAVVHRQLGSVELKTGAPRDALRLFQEAETVLGRLVERNPTDRGWQSDLAHVLLSVGEAHIHLGNADEAAQAISLGLRHLQSQEADQGRDRALISLVADGFLLLGVTYDLSGQSTLAHEHWQRTTDILSPYVSRASDPEILTTWSEALLRLGRSGEATSAVERLQGAGYRDPTLNDLWRSRRTEDSEPKPHQQARGE